MKINLEKIKVSSRGIRLCVITDIHHIKGINDKFYYQILSKIEGKVDYILIPGDIIDHPNIILTKDIFYLINFIKKLSLLAPVIISKGNHEQKENLDYINILYKKLRKLKNVYVLDNETIILNNCKFIGFSPSYKVYLRGKNKEENFIKEFNDCNFKLDKTKINIMLSHSPETVIRNNIINNIPLIGNLDYIICGHMHNGLVPKKFEFIFKNRGLFGPNYTLFPNYCRSIHKFGKSGNMIICKSLRVMTKDNLLFKIIDSFYSKNITFIDI